MRLVLLISVLFFQSGALADDEFYQPVPNPNINMRGFLDQAQEAAEYRRTHLLTEEQFISFSGRTNAVILDARSARNFEWIHVRGAINLS